MIGSRRKNDGSGSERLTAIRDIVEIVAIVLAGVWAIYTFIYNDNIRPYQSPPTLVVDTKLDPVGAKGSLQAIELTQTLRNTGTVGFRMLAIANVVSGERVVGAAAEALHVKKSDFEVSFARGVERAKSEIAYYGGRRYDGAGGTTSIGFTLDPGESNTEETIFYVPRGRYDALRYSGDFRFTKQMHETIPVTLVHTRGGGLTTHDLNAGCALSPPAGCRSGETTANATLSLWPAH